jgi:TonB-linked SusC/RagA family outer membrane protein
MKTKFSGILTLFLAFVVQLTFAQEKTISGVVTDDNGLPLPAATVLVKGTSNGTSTDFDGNYSITANTGDVLQFSYVGYATMDKTVGTASTISVSLVADNELDEVVVTALGIKRKQDELTTANQVVKTEELVKANNPDVLNSLSGKVSGLQVTKTSSGVSGTNRIVLRGNRSITGDNQALIVIDGAISTASFLSSLDPNIIESINVIKGANGAALYGQDGSNGVLIVTTKSGSGSEKMIINVKSTIDIESVAFVPEQQTRYGQGWDYGNGGYENVSYENGAWGPEFDGQLGIIGLPQADGTYVVAPYESRGADNVKDFFDTGYTYQNSFNLSAGDSDAFVFVSAQHQDTEFIIKNDELKKSTFNLKAGKTLGKWRLGGNATYSRTATTEAEARDFNNSIYRQLLQTATNVPIREFEFSGNEGSTNGYFLNPYWVRDNLRRNRQADRFNLLADVQYNINDNINVVLRSNGIFTYSSSTSEQAAYNEPGSVTAITGFDRSLPAYFSTSNSMFSRYYTDLLVNFDYNLTDDVTFKANVGLNNQYTKNSTVAVAGEGLSIPGVYSTSNFSGAFDPDGTFNTFSSFRTYSAFANVDLGYKDFLFLNVTGRNDWSSLLAKENNSFFYPGAGLAFIPTKAFENLKGNVLNYAKVSANYVKVGSTSDITPYAVQNRYAQASGFPFNGNNSFVLPTSITDPLIEPEFTTSFEVGLNLGFLKDRVTLDANYYSFTTDNQVTSVTASRTSGLSTSRVNLSETEGWGTEIDLGLVPIKTDNFRWNLNLGFTKNYTEVVRISDESNEVGLGGFASVQAFAIAGEQFPVLKGTDYERDPQGRVIVDANGTPQQASGLVNLGTTTPDYIVNLNTSFTYKDFTFAATMDYRTGHVFYSQAHNGMLFSGHTVETAQNGRGAYIFPNSVINTGTDANPVYVQNTNVATASSGSAFINSFADYAGIAKNSVFDATAFKVRELSLSYNLNPKYLQNTFISAVTLSAVGRNLINIFPEENRGYADPETNFTNGGNGAGLSTFDQYPSTKTYGFSVNLTF